MLNVENLTTLLKAKPETHAATVWQRMTEGVVPMYLCHSVPLILRMLPVQMSERAVRIQS